MPEPARTDGGYYQPAYIRQIDSGAIQAQTWDQGGSIIVKQSEKIPNNITVQIRSNEGYLALERNFLADGCAKIELFGGKGKDTIDVKLLSSKVSIAIWGGDGEDSISVETKGSDSSLYIYGGAQSDVISISGNGFHDVDVSGDAGDDSIFLSRLQANDKPLVFGGPGKDLIYGSIYADYIFGDDGDDEIWGLGGVDYFDGGAGNDIIYGGAGGSKLFGGDGDDTLYGGDGADYLFGGWGNDYLFGGSGYDSLSGGSDDDFLFGGDGRDYLYGDRGNDYLDGGADAYKDVLSGDAGSDTFVEMHDPWATNVSDFCCDFDSNEDRKKTIDWF